MTAKDVLNRTKKLLGPKGEHWIRHRWAKDSGNPNFLNYCLTGGIAAACQNPLGESEGIEAYNDRLSNEHELPPEGKVAACALAEEITGEVYNPNKENDVQRAWSQVIQFNDSSARRDRINGLINRAIKRLDEAA